ncbi:hypothetical protein AVEN_270953-1 [Araneus ventricosus]|uniref:Uncharacterized protein n=1 Tax=Araneus ventricosus TaxID=182803 RepID=A0A4Y2L4G3_ARAVE|nr:hypothetical protein AVEN_270953-1 [Araneus ventricosus]
MKRRWISNGVFAFPEGTIKAWTCPLLVIVWTSFERGRPWTVMAVKRAIHISSKMEILEHEKFKKATLIPEKITFYQHGVHHLRSNDDTIMGALLSNLHPSGLSRKDSSRRLNLKRYVLLSDALCDVNLEIYERSTLPKWHVRSPHYSIFQPIHLEGNCVRRFVIPALNFGAADYVDLIDWQAFYVLPPTVLRHIGSHELLKIIQDDVPMDGWDFIKFLSHTKAVERIVKLVTEASRKRVGPQNRDGFIRATLESRKQMSQFESKKLQKIVRL